MQFASKMMLVPYNKDAKCINIKSESEKILKNKNLNTSEKLIRYRARVEQERDDQKSKETKSELEEQEEAAIPGQEKQKEGDQEAAQSTVDSTPQASQVEHDLRQLVQQLQQQLQEQLVQQQILQKEREQQTKLAKSKSLQLRQLQDRVYVSPETESRPSKKRKVLPNPAPVAYPFTYTSPPLAPPTKQTSKKLLTPALVHKLDVMPEEADKNPNLPAFGVYDRQFVVPNKRITRTALNWKQY